MNEKANIQFHILKKYFLPRKFARLFSTFLFRNVPPLPKCSHDRKHWKLTGAKSGEYAECGITFIITDYFSKICLAVSMRCHAKQEHLSSLPKKGTFWCMALFTRSSCWQKRLQCLFFHVPIACKGWHIRPAWIQRHLLKTSWLGSCHWFLIFW